MLELEKEKENTIQNEENKYINKKILPYLFDQFLHLNPGTSSQENLDS